MITTTTIINIGMHFIWALDWIFFPFMDFATQNSGKKELKEHR
jgi:hypothetical protein